jgi:hypothetical protein
VDDLSARPVGFSAVILTPRTTSNSKLSSDSDPLSLSCILWCLYDLRVLRKETDRGWWLLANEFRSKSARSPGSEYATRGRRDG